MSTGAHAGRDHLTWIGHGTVLIAMGGTRVLVDPILRPRVMHLKRFHPIPKHALRSLDAVMITHLHHDHLDPPSLESLGKDLPIIMPAGSAQLLRRKRFTRVIEIGEGERIQIGALKATATHADHPSKRDHPLSGSADPLGFLFEGSKRIYVAGDTDLFDEMELIGPVDYACLPVTGWGPGLGPGHMDPERAAEAARRLQAKVAIPIHWGTLWPIGLGKPPREPADEFVDHCVRVAPASEARLLEPGSTIEF